MCVCWGEGMCESKWEVAWGWASFWMFLRMISWLWADFWGQDMRCFQDLLGSKIFPNSFQKELTSWRSILVWKEGLALVLAWPWFYACLLNLTPQVRLWGWLLGPLCVPLCSFVVRGQRRRHIPGPLIVNAIGPWQVQSLRRKFLVTKRAFFTCTSPLPPWDCLGWEIWGFQDPLAQFDYDKDVGVPLRLTEC